MDQNINQYVDTLFANMENFSQKDGLIGKPVMQGDKTFMPVMAITLGYGGGDTQSKSNMNNTTKSAGGGMSGGALGIGAKLSAEAVIVIDKDNVLMAPIGAPGGMGQVLNKIPQILSSMGGGAQGGAQAGQQSQSQTGTASQQNTSSQAGTPANKSMY